MNREIIKTKLDDGTNEYLIVDIIDKLKTLKENRKSKISSAEIRNMLGNFTDNATGQNYLDEVTRDNAIKARVYDSVFKSTNRITVTQIGVSE